MALPLYGLLSVVAVLSLTIYHNSLDCDFVFDDMSAIRDNTDLRPEIPVLQLFQNDFWGTPMNEERSHKSYRPLTVLTFRLNYLITELNPWSYHLINILLHTVISVQVLLCVLRYSDRISLLSAVMFAVHPVHSEAVTGVVGRAELLSASLVLLILCIYVYISRSHPTVEVWYYPLLPILILSATLCKEQGITAAGICLVFDIIVLQQTTLHDIPSIIKHPFDWIQRHKSFIRRLFILISSTAAVLLVRLKVMGAQLPTFTLFDNPATNQSTPYRQLTFNYLLPVNMWLLICPAQLCCDWTMGTIPVVDTLLDYRNLYTILFYGVMYKISIYAFSHRSKTRDQVALGLCLMVIPFLPASNLFFPVGFVVAERVLYLPSLGFCLLFSVLADFLYQQYYSHSGVRFALSASVLLLLFSSCLRTYTRNKDWKNDLTLFSSGLRSELVYR